MMTVDRKLSDAEIQELRLAVGSPGVTPARYLQGGMPQALTDLARLLVHIDAMEAENQRWGSRAAKDAYESGAAIGAFIKEQTDRIEKLEKKLSALTVALTPIVSGFYSLKRNGAIKARVQIGRSKGIDYSELEIIVGILEEQVSAEGKVSEL